AITRSTVTGVAAASRERRSLAQLEEQAGRHERQQARELRYGRDLRAEQHGEERKRRRGEAPAQRAHRERPAEERVAEEEERHSGPELQGAAEGERVAGMPDRLLQRRGERDD